MSENTSLEDEGEAEFSFLSPSGFFSAPVKVVRGAAKGLIVLDRRRDMPSHHAWSVTHTSSGTSLGVFRTVADARRFATHPVITDIDWSCDLATLRTKLSEDDVLGMLYVRQECDGRGAVSPHAPAPVVMGEKPPAQTERVRPPISKEMEDLHNVSAAEIAAYQKVLTQGMARRRAEYLAWTQDPNTGPEDFKEFSEAQRAKATIEYQTWVRDYRATQR